MTDIADREWAVRTSMRVSVLVATMPNGVERVDEEGEFDPADAHYIAKALNWARLHMPKDPA